jgi:RNA-directed DNA polymerase
MRGWARTFPAVPFERYCDDIIVHARSERQALQLRAMIASRLAECGLLLNERKTRIVYCKDDDRRGSHKHTSFDSLATRSVRGGRRVGSGSTS